MTTPRRRTALLAVAAWLLAVVAAAWLSWTAIDAAGRQVAGPVVPRQADPAPLPPASTPPTRSGGSPTGAAPTVSPPTVPPQTTPAAAARTVATRGGVVAASCAAAAVDVTYATPVDGWAAEVEHEGRREARVEFRSGGERVRVRLSCVSGRVEAAVEQSDPGSSEDSDRGEDG